MSTPHHQPEQPIKTHADCPRCGHNKCLSVWENGFKKCHSQDCYADDWKLKGKFTDMSKDDEGLEEKVLVHRNINEKVQKFYGVTTSVDETGKEVRRVYPYPHRAKFRYLPKDFSKNPGFTGDHLFGMDKFNAGSSKFITVVEGEEDVLSAYQMLGEKYPVVGVPGASISRALLRNCHEYLDSFTQIVVAADNDEAGEAMANKLAATFPNKVYKVSLTKYNDPNEYLMNGEGADFKYAWFNRTKFTPDNILNAPEQFLDLYRETPDHQYVPTGISELDDKIMGIMQGHFTVLKAETGIGKTELFRKLQHKFLKEGVTIGSWHLEETKTRSLLGLVSYELKENLTRKDIIESKSKETEVEGAIVELTKDENLYQFYLSDGSTADDLITQIRYLVEACGVQYVFFEPIQDVLGGDEQLLSDLAIRLSKLSAELNVGIVTIAHTNEDGEIKYCKMIGQRASVIIELQREKDAVEEEVRNTTTLYVRKNRPCADLGYGGQLSFDPKTFTLKEKL